MNYKQKYKEALEWMRSIYPTMQGVDKEDAEHYFPELRESEDERIRKAIVEFFECQDDNTTYSFVPKQSILAWLEKQGKQPSWSEKDDDMLSKLIKHFEWKDTGYRFTKEDCLEATNWLKSLKPQPHWKPSEEQMEAIKYFIDFHRPQANASIEGWNEFKHLESLYNDLKNFESWNKLPKTIAALKLPNS